MDTEERLLDIISSFSILDKYEIAGRKQNELECRMIKQFLHHAPALTFIKGKHPEIEISSEDRKKLDFVLRRWEEVRTDALAKTDRYTQKKHQPRPKPVAIKKEPVAVTANQSEELSEETRKRRELEEWIKEWDERDAKSRKAEQEFHDWLEDLKRKDEIAAEENARNS